MFHLCIASPLNGGGQTQSSSSDPHLLDLLHHRHASRLLLVWVDLILAIQQPQIWHLASITLFSEAYLLRVHPFIGRKFLWEPTRCNLLIQRNWLLVFLEASSQCLRYDVYFIVNMHLDYLPKMQFVLKLPQSIQLFLFGQLDESIEGKPIFLLLLECKLLSKASLHVRSINKSKMKGHINNHLISTASVFLDLFALHLV